MQLPNLTISSWYTEYQPQQGGEGRWQWRVFNNGNAAAPAGVDVNLMLSTDRNISSEDHWVIYEEIPFALEPGSEAYRDEDNEKQFTFPETIPPGTYYMAMWVDDIQEVRECDENDNVLIGQNGFELRSTKPDLTATSWYAQWDAAGDGTLEYSVENIGTVAAARTDWRITLLLHTNPDISLGDREPSTLPSAGDRRPERFNGRLPPNALTRRVEIIDNGDGARSARVGRSSEGSVRSTVPPPSAKAFPLADCG